MNHVTRYHVTDTNILHTVLLSVLWFVWFGFCFSAFLICFQRGIKMFSWKKFCICSREMGQKWILKNFRVLWERNYFTRLWHWNFSIMSTSPLPHILSVVALLSPILSKKKLISELIFFKYILLNILFCSPENMLFCTWFISETFGG